MLSLLGGGGGFKVNMNELGNVLWPDHSAKAIGHCPIAIGHDLWP